MRFTHFLFAQRHGRQCPPFVVPLRGTLDVGEGHWWGRRGECGGRPAEPLGPGITMEPWAAACPCPALPCAFRAGWLPGLADRLLLWPPGSCWSSPASCCLCSPPSRSTRRARRARSTSWWVPRVGADGPDGGGARGRQPVPGPLGLISQTPTGRDPRPPGTHGPCSSW